MVIQENGSLVEIRKEHLKMLVEKNELILEGNNTDLVSSSVFSMWWATTIKNKDIGRILDGSYVSERTVQQPDE